MVEGLDSATWSSLDADRRLEVLQQIEDLMAGIQGRPPVPVTQELMGASTFGGFDGRGIVLNAAHLESEMPVDEFIDTMVHEGRHAYQAYAIDHPGFVADEETVASWAANRERYLDPETYGPERYANHPLQADAWDYASRVVQVLGWPREGAI